MINWDSFNNDLKTIKNKHTLIFKFFNLMEFFDDDNASKILRIIINYCFDIFVNYPFYKLSKFIPTKRYPETLTVLITFYELIKEKTQLILALSKWHMAYKNKIYWKKDNKCQIEILINLRMHIRAIFDCVVGDQSFGIKIIPIVKTNINNSKDLVFENAVERLIKLHKLLGPNFFKTAKIPTMIVQDFYNLKDDEKIKYIILIQSKTLHIIDQTIEIYEKFDMVNLKIDNLLNPFSVHIENDTFTDYDVEDIKALL
jgi:hypothetical protein